jgi:acyl carrier protein
MTPPGTAEVFSVLQQRLATKLAIPPRAITHTTRLTEDLGVDSLTAVELLIEIEDRFGVVITDQEAGQMSTVGQAAELIARRLRD